MMTMDHPTPLHDLHKLQFKRMLRKNQTPAESVLWEVLRNRKLKGTKWRRQANVDVFIADFLCPEHRLIIEVDGGIHDYRHERDRLRTEVIGAYDYRVLRFKNDEVLQELPSVLQRIEEVMNGA